MNNSSKIWRLLPIIIFVALAAVFLYRLYGEDPSVIPSVLIEKPMPTYNLDPLGDLASFNSTDLNQELVVVNFWASWCVACRAEHLELDKLKQMGIKVYGINHKDNDANALEFLTKYGNVYEAIGTNKSGRVGINFGVRALPETFIIDKNGIIRYKQIGPILAGEGFDNFVKQFNTANQSLITK